MAGVRVATVTDVNLTFEGIGDAGATQLADAVRDNNSAVKQLKLAGNSIGDAGAAQLADALRTSSSSSSSSSSVRELNLRNNLTSEVVFTYLRTYPAYKLTARCDAEESKT